MNLRNPLHYQTPQAMCHKYRWSLISLEAQVGLYITVVLIMQDQTIQKLSSEALYTQTITRPKYVSPIGIIAESIHFNISHAF